VLLLVAAAALAAAAPPPEGGALERAAEALASAALRSEPPGRVAVAVTAPGASGLCPPLAAALTAAVGRLGHAALPLPCDPGGDAEAAERAARAGGADVLLAARAALAGADLALAGEVRALRPNFFLQAAPALRGPARTASVAVPADAAARAFARAAHGERAPAVVPLAEVPGAVLALAAGPVGGAGPARMAALTADALLLLDARGAVIATRALPAAERRVRDPGGAVAIGPFPGGPLAWAASGRDAGEVVAARAGRLEPVGPFAAAPLAAGGAGALLGRFARGGGTLEDALGIAPGPVPPPASPRALLGAAAAPRAGRVAFAALRDDFTLSLLGPALEPAGELQGVGAGFALADLDGDGEPEVVASSARPGPGDAIRVLRGDGRTLVAPVAVAGALRAGAAADLTGDGVDDAVLAAVLPGGRTQLWLVTSDPRAGATP
jgi:hypothetical protein